MLNQKGGVGKTTSTVNIGAAAARAGWRTCLIDLDPQAHLTLHLGIDPPSLDWSVYDLLVEPDLPAEAVIVRNREFLDVVPADTDLAGAETELSSVPDRNSLLRRKLAPVLDRYDVVLLDCPPSLGVLTLNALTLAGEIIVPMQAHFLALQGVSKLLETVGLVSRSVNPELRVTGVLLCMHEGQTTLAREIVADLDRFFADARSLSTPWAGCRVLRPPIRRNIKLAEAPSFGQTIFEYEPWCAGGLDYKRLAESMLGSPPEATEAGSAPSEADGAATSADGAGDAGDGERTDEAPPVIETRPALRPVAPHDGPGSER